MYSTSDNAEGHTDCVSAERVAVKANVFDRVDAKHNNAEPPFSLPMPTMRTTRLRAAVGVMVHVETTPYWNAGPADRRDTLVETVAMVVGCNAANGVNYAAFNCVSTKSTTAAPADSDRTRR
jgi:hypothetical protein